MHNNSARQNKFTKLAATAAVLTLIFVLCLGLFLTGDILENGTSGQFADATAGVNYTIANETINFNVDALNGSSFTLDEIWNGSSLWDYSNIASGTRVAFTPAISNGEGTGIQGVGENSTNTYNVTQYADVVLRIPANVTITDITVAARIYARTKGTNGRGSADHSTTATYSIIPGTGSAVQVGTVTADEYGNRGEAKNVNGSATVSGLELNNNNTITLRTTINCYREQASSVVQRVDHRAQIRDVSVTLKGYYTFPSGTGTESNPYQLRNRTDFDGLRVNVLGGTHYSGQSFIVNPDNSNSQTEGARGTINMLGTTFTAIGHDDDGRVPFRGILEGNGCTINNLRIADINVQRSGLFGSLGSGATIKNLKINAAIGNGNSAGVGASDSQTTRAILAGNISGGGGTVTIENCDILGGNVSGAHQIGAFVGYLNNATLNLTNCTNSATISSLRQFTSQENRTSVGGLVGYANASSTINVTNCSNTGVITTYSTAVNGGIGGLIGFTNGETTIIGSHNEGTIGANSTHYVGGLVGYANDRIAVSGSYNTGNVNGAYYVGGIVGAVQNTNSTINNCYSTGNISASDYIAAASIGGVQIFAGNGSYAGGIAGVSFGSISYCYSTGRIYAAYGFAAGITSAAHRQSTLNYNYTFATLGYSGTHSSGVGYVLGHAFPDGDATLIDTSTCWAFFSSLPGAGNNIGEVHTSGSTSSYVRGRGAYIPIQTSLIDQVQPYYNGATVPWTDILTKEIQHFALEYENVPEGNFVSATKIAKGDSQAAAQDTTTAATITDIQSSTSETSLNVALVFYAGQDRTVEAYSGTDNYIGVTVSLQRIPNDVVPTNHTYGDGTDFINPNVGLPVYNNKILAALYNRSGDTVGAWVCGYSSNPSDPYTIAPLVDAGTHNYRLRLYGINASGRAVQIGYGNYTTVVAKKTLTVTPTTTATYPTYTYNGARQGLSSVVIGGFISGQAASDKITQSGTQSVGVAVVAAATTLTFNLSATINYKQDAYTFGITVNDGNYEFASGSTTSWSWQINRRVLTVTTKGYTGVYNGINQEATLTIGNIVADDNTIPNLNFTYVEAGEDGYGTGATCVQTILSGGERKFTITQTNVSQTNGGKYTLTVGATISGTMANNYTIAETSVNIEITPATMTISYSPSQAVSQPYNGQDYSVSLILGNLMSIDITEEKRIEPKVVDQDGKEITAEKDDKNNKITYKISYTDVRRGTKDEVLAYSLTLNDIGDIAGNYNTVEATTATLTITPYDLSSNTNYSVAYSGIVYNKIWYNNPDFTADLTRYTSASVNGVPQGGEQGILLYSYDNWNDLETHRGLFAVCGIPGEGKGIEAKHSKPVIDENDNLIGRIQYDQYTMLTGNKNYTGTVYVNYTLIDSDYDTVDGGDRTNENDRWGSEDNPFVISSWLHLLRLSEIVNGISYPIDSVSGMGVLSSGGYTQANSTTYGPWRDAGTGDVYSSYFVLTANIDMPTWVNFKPIGDNSTYQEAPVSNTQVVLPTGDGEYEIVSTPTFTDSNTSVYGFRLTSGAGLRLVKVYGRAEGASNWVYLTTVRGESNLTGKQIIRLANAVNYHQYRFYVDGVNGSNYAGSTFSFIGADVTQAQKFGGNFDGSENCMITIPNGLGGSGHDYVGLFGRVGGEAFADITIQNVTLNASVEGYHYVGGIVGSLESYSILKNVKLADNNTVKGNSHVGGIVGRVDGSAKLYGSFVNNNTVEATSGYVGGIAGLIMSGAGHSSNASTFIIGMSEAGSEKTGSYRNSGAVSAGGDYVGGIFGAMLQNQTEGYEGLFTVFAPAYARNTANISGGDYVGGIIGYVGGNNRVELVNPQGVDLVNPQGGVSVFDIIAGAGRNYSYNGTISGSTPTSVNGFGNNIGGMFGYLGELNHVLTRVFSTADVVGDINVGGLVGHMLGGVITSSFLGQPSGNIVTEDTDKIRRTDTAEQFNNVGGIVGNLQSGSVIDSIALGFNFSSVANTRGGVIGLQNSIATVTDSWTIYLTENPTFSTVVANSNGKYILADKDTLNGTDRNNSLAAAMTFADLAVFSGLASSTGGIASATTNGSTQAQLNKLTMAITLPVPETMTGAQGEEYQVVFYNEGTTETASPNAFNAANPTTSTLEIRVGKEEQSFKVCKTEIHFYTIASSEMLDENAWEEKYVSLSGDNRYRADVSNLNNADGAYTGTIRISFAPTWVNDTAGVYVYTSRTVNFSFTEHSEVAPYTISTLQEWITFANSVTTGINYSGKYVKLLADINGNFNMTGAEIESNFSGIAGEDYKMLLDGNTRTKYCVKGLSSTKQLKFTITLSSAQPIGGYAWCTANDSASNLGRNPAYCKVEGSVDNSNWTTIDERGAGTSTPATYPSSNYTWQSYPTNGSTTSYRYVRVTVYPSSGEIFQMSEFRLIGAVPAGDFQVDGSVNRFEGVFDGNGKTISIDLRGNNRISLFPGAANAVFKNLTLSGELYSSGYDVAAFVGKAMGSLTFENCTNRVNITGVGGDSRNYGGFIGYTSGGRTFNMIGCVNQGIISAQGTEAAGGTGGIIGNVGESSHQAYTESCRNTAAITGHRNTAGLVGRVNGYLLVQNCANTGNIEATRTEHDDTCAAGIAALITDGGSADFYASYNSGNVLAGMNMAGGIVATDSQSDNAEIIAKHKTKIYYCYNTGNITTRKNRYTGWALGDGLSDRGGYVGGIIGEAKNVDIRYCYNAGTITNNGVIGAPLAWRARVGGIAGAADKYRLDIYYSYNVGAVRFTAVGVLGDAPGYAGGIIGDPRFTDADVEVVGCYSLKYCVQWLNGNGIWRYMNKYTEGDVVDNKDAVDATLSGYTVTLAEMTAVYSQAGLKASNTLSLNDRIVPVAGGTNATLNNEQTVSGGTNNNSFGATGNVQVLREGINGTSGGWIYVYGCLPQLAVFALDTQDGLAMTSIGYGYDALNDTYVQQPAGGSLNPYIIKDGVDLMGLSALTDANRAGVYWTADDKHIEFANGANNLEGHVSNVINMEGDYKFGNGDTINDQGKSYHLYSKGAVKNGDFNIVNNSGQGATDYTCQTYWRARNYVWDSTANAYKNNVSITDVNFYAVGLQGGERTFKGTISGTQTSGQTEIRGLKADYTSSRANVYNGLFATASNASIRDITVTGSIVTRSSNNSSDNNAAYAGIIGLAQNNTQIIGVQAGTTTNALNISALSAYANRNSSRAGGIVGGADAGSAGNRLLIADCTVVNANIVGCHASIGGILGRSNGASTTSIVEIENCAVLGATISSTGNSQARSDTNAWIGGIAGARASTGTLNFKDCSVGNPNQVNGAVSTDSASTAYKVRISGENAVGGICSQANASANGSTSFNNCYIYGDVLIQRKSSSSTAARNNVDHGTAFGGVIGYVADRESADTAAITAFLGNLEFYGMIDLSGVTGSSAVPTQNVGGIVGYMGSSSRMAGTTVKSYGTIKSSGNAAAYTQHIGGFAGLSSGGILDGRYFIATIINTSEASYVGGFIGLNTGNTYITRTADIYTAKWTDANGDHVIDTNELTNGGSISANTQVGGFIGGNTATGTQIGLHVGTATAEGTPYGDNADRADIVLLSTVDGKKDVGGFIGRNDGNLYGEYCTVRNSGAVGTTAGSQGGTAQSPNEGYGGVIGLNGIGGSVNFGEHASFSNVGQVGNTSYRTHYQTFVGGIIGISLGDFVNRGTLTNNGAVYGYTNVGGAIGVLVRGTLSGSLSNQGAVTAVKNVGGIVGVIMQDASVTTNGIETVLSNSGTVTGSGEAAEGYVTNLGGAVGILYGTITGRADSIIQFQNTGNVSAANFAGGAVGVINGTISYASFVNSADITFTGNTAMGGAIGYITSHYSNDYPTSNTESLPSYTSTTVRWNGNWISYKPSQVTNTYFAYQSANQNTSVTLQATGANPYTPISTEGFSPYKVNGGLGGVIGVINSPDITTTDHWQGNTFFIYGNVYGGTFNDNDSANFTNDNFVGKVDAVGGVVGAVDGSYVTISNMLVYKSNVGGKDSVGGIVGYNASTNIQNGVTGDELASIDNCYNVGGDIIGSSNYGGIVGNVLAARTNIPLTNASYWILPFSNTALNGASTSNLGPTLNAQFTVPSGTGATGNTQAGMETANFTLAYMLNNPDEPLNLGFESWQEMALKYGDLNSVTMIENSNLGWGYYVYDNTKRFSTGAQDGSTGYFFVYANDAVSKNLVTTDVNTIHSANDSDNLAYWRYIADAVGHTGTKQSDIVYDYNHISGYTDNISIGNLYAFAHASSNVENAYGYFLNIYADNNDGLITNTSTNNGDSVYIDAIANTAGNVMIYYKEAVMVTNMVYNGLERTAPLQGVQYKNLPTAQNGMNDAELARGGYSINTLYYSYSASSAKNVATNVGIYNTDVIVWMVTNQHRTASNSAALYYVALLGYVKTKTVTENGVTTTKYQWRINERPLTVTVGTNSSDGPVYSGYYEHYLEIKVDNIVYPGGSAIAGTYANGMQFDFYAYRNSLPISTAVRQAAGLTIDPLTQNNSEILWSVSYAGSGNNMDRLYNTGNLPVNVHTITFRLYVKNAGTYGFNATSIKNSSAYLSSNYRLTPLSEANTLIISPKVLSAIVDDYSNPSSTGFVYDGTTQYGKRISLSGWAAGDAGQVADLIKELSIEWTSGTGYEMRADDGSMILLYAINKAQYAVTLSGSLDNYSITEQNITWVISENIITVTWTSGGSKEYDGNEATIVLTMRLSKASSVFLDELASIIGSQAFTNTANQTFTVNYTVGPNAGTYTRTINDPQNENFSFSTTSESSHRFVINRRALTTAQTWFGDTAPPPFTFNGGTEYQGAQIVIGRIVSKDASILNFTQTGAHSVTRVTGRTDTIRLNTVNAGDYRVSIGLSGAAASNYTLNGATTAWNWTINKKQIDFNANISQTNIVYDGRLHTATITVNGQTLSGATMTFGNQTLTIGNISYGNGNTVGACNVGTYNLSISGGSGTVTNNSQAVAGTTATIDNYDLNGTGLDAAATMTITPRQISLVWDNASGFIFQNTLNGNVLSSTSLVGLATRSILTTTKNTNSVTQTARGAYISGNNPETITYLLSYSNPINAGNCTVTASISSISGNNEAGTTNSAHGNYTLSNNTTTFSRARSVVSFASLSGSFSKEFNNDAIATGNGNVNYTLSATGHVPTINNLAYTAVYYYGDSQVVNACDFYGSSVKYNVNITVTTQLDNNYEWAATAATIANAGIIYPRALIVMLNNSTSSSSNVYKTFDNSTLYASVTSNGNDSIRSTGSQYRTGRGITVSGFYTAGIDVSANFVELGDRSWASKYINDINRTLVTADNGNTSYQYATATSGSYYKALQIVLSSDDNSYQNYYIKSVTKRDGTELVGQSGQSQDSHVDTITIRDSRDTTSSSTGVFNTEGKNLRIAINRYSVLANYQNTTQSYANADNSYNRDWKPVTASLNIPSSWNSTGISILVANNWMFRVQNNIFDNNGYIGGTPDFGENYLRAAQYTSYTRLVGRTAAFNGIVPNNNASSSNRGLGATITSSDGTHLCITLRNQPTLIIGYFVENEGGYEIGSMAGLLIATEYYKGNFNDNENETSYIYSIGEFSVPTTIGEETVSFTNWAAYLNEWAAVYPNQEYDITTHPQYASLTQEQKNTVEYTIYHITNGSSYVEREGYIYWIATEQPQPVYTSFRMISDIDAILTVLDVQLLNQAFGEGNWGVGREYLGNVTFASTGNAVVLNDSLFEGIFSGIFIGGGYVLDHLQIIKTVSSASATTVNLGVFASVGESGGMQGRVDTFNVRNANFQLYDMTGLANVINVGGIIGLNRLATALNNCSFHGTINVYATGAGSIASVGGIVGFDYTSDIDTLVDSTQVESAPIINAISVATINVYAGRVNAGGIVGMLKASNKIVNAVSVSEIYAQQVSGSAYVGGLIGLVVDEGSVIVSSDGQVSGAITAQTPVNNVLSVGTYQNAYLQNAVYAVVSGTYTESNRAVGNGFVDNMGRSYSALYGGSESAHLFNGGYYVGGTDKESTPTTYTKGIYDVLQDIALMPEASEHQSMRLADIIDVYVLKYNITRVAISGENAEVYGSHMYRKSAISQLVGTAKGTTDSTIGLAYQQHISLLRIFNYMNFTLYRTITMYENYVPTKCAEVFSGSITSVIPNGSESPTSDVTATAFVNIIGVSTPFGAVNLFARVYTTISA